MDGRDEDMRIVPGNRQRLQLARVKKGGWTKARRRAFLEALAQCCNIGMACDAVTVTSSVVYRLRARDEQFAAEWEAALRIGYERLEQALLRRALEVVDGFDVADGPAELPAMTIEQAMRFLERHGRSVREGRLSTRRSATRMPTVAETDALILKRLDAYDRNKRRGA